jgi:hypothetical protein
MRVPEILPIVEEPVGVAVPAVQASDAESDPDIACSVFEDRSIVVAGK